MEQLFGSIEAGGTKFVCAYGTGPRDIRRRQRVDTTTPTETLGAVVDFFRACVADIGPPAAFGIASFGPVDPKVGSPTFGTITTTPKTKWRNTDVVGPIRWEFSVPVGFDTDVNGAALGEGRWGAAAGLDTYLYLTVGTGVGGGLVVNGSPVHGLLHPEMGHVRVRRPPGDGDFPGVCPFHGDCLEGLASGPAIENRWGSKASELPEDHEAWEYEAAYLSEAISTFLYIASAQRVILGGGVMHQTGLFPRIRARVGELLAHYLEVPPVLEGLGEVIVPPGLGDDAGIAGGFVLAQQAAKA